MGERVKSFFGGRTRAQKQAQREAELAQRRSARDAEEEAQRLRAETEASGRRLQMAGRRMLTFQPAGGGASTLGG